MWVRVFRVYVQREADDNHLIEKLSNENESTRKCEIRDILSGILSIGHLTLDTYAKFSLIGER